MKKQDKELALTEWLDMIKKSWTYGKMTNEERERLENNVIKWFNNQGMLKGTYRERWQVLNGVYIAFLEGLGYTPLNWRE